MKKKKRDDWEKLDEKEMKRNEERIVWKKKEGIEVKKIYKKEDMEGIGNMGKMKGFEKLMRGKREKMYEGSKWKIRKYEGL